MKFTCCVCSLDAFTLQKDNFRPLSGADLGGAEGAAVPPFSSSEIYFFVKIYNNFIIL